MCENLNLWQGLIFDFVKETCVVVWTLNCKRKDLGKLESLVDFMITCLCDCGIVVALGKACNRGKVD